MRLAGHTSEAMNLQLSFSLSALATGGRRLWNIAEFPDHSGLMPADLITLPHSSVSSAGAARRLGYINQATGRKGMTACGTCNAALRSLSERSGH
jgi:hypothetical protein